MISLDLVSISAIRDSLNNKERIDIINMLKYWLYRELHVDLGIYNLQSNQYPDYPKFKRFLSNNLTGEFTKVTSEIFEVEFVPLNCNDDIYIKYHIRESNEYATG